MLNLKHITPPLLLFFFSCCISLHFNVVGARKAILKENAFSPKAYVHRYWSKQISNDLPKPSFLLDKASPLTAVETAAFTQLADQNILSTHLRSFCSAANLLCLPNSLDDIDDDHTFNTYDTDRNFSNYGTEQVIGTNSFTNYSQDGNVVTNSFNQYNKDAQIRHDVFTNYATESNVVNQSFTSYDVDGIAGEGTFTNYNTKVNVPNLEFTSYSTDGNSNFQKFTTYTSEANSGSETFTTYGHGTNSPGAEFTSYGNDSNVIISSFSSYDHGGNSPNETFTSYGSSSNNPQNNFKSYDNGGNSAESTFTNYRDHANVGDDSFQSYAKHAQTDIATTVKFSNYGQSLNNGSDTFKGYAKDPKGGEQSTVDFKVYGVNTTFKDYSKESAITFSKYNHSLPPSELAERGIKVNRWVEPGKFFREKMLQVGTVMPMPDIVDKMPKRSFLPRIILGKIPFSTSKLEELKRVFRAGGNSSMTRILTSALSECERAPSQGETKRCVGSVEDMIDFATMVLGHNVIPKTTENTRGSNQNIMIGSIKKINGGRITKSVSCHQSMYPYLLYYCHSVPKVRVYEVDLLDMKLKAKINHGVALCHVDTSVWSANHGAFVALGPGPGKIEVCHWIFENDLTWVIAD